MEFSFCEWLGKLIVVDKKNVNVTTKELARTQESSLNYLKSITQPLPTKCSKYLCCKCIVDAQRGCRVPHLLVTHAPYSAQQQDSILHELLVYESSDGSFKECGLKFESPKSAIPDDMDNVYHLMDGPVVIWTEGTNIHIVCGPKYSQTFIDLQTIATDLELNKVERMWCYCAEEDIPPQSFFLLIKLLLKKTKYMQEFGAKEWMCLKVEVQGNLPLDLIPFGAEAVQIPDLIPSHYGCIATCIASHRHFCIDGTSGAMLEKTVFIVGTELQQVVIIEEGALRHAIPIHFTPRHVVAMQTQGDSVALAVMSQSGEVSAYEITVDGSKDRGTWSDVSACATGDFAELGRNQILMLIDGVDSGKFCLTDLLDYSGTDHHLTNEDEGTMVEEEIHCPDSLLSILKALQLKKHTSEAHLTQYEICQQYKHELLTRSLKFMGSIGRKTKSPPINADLSLICLIPGKVAEFGSSAAGSSDVEMARGGREPPALEVMKVWQRIGKSGEWVVALKAKNCSKKVLTDMGACFVLSGDPLIAVGSCRVLWSDSTADSQVLQTFFSACNSNGPPEKRRRLEVLLTALESKDEGWEEECERKPLRPGAAVCLVITTTDLRVPGQETTIVGMWKEEGSAGELVAGEITQVKMDMRLLHSEDLSIDESCLDIWNGHLSMSGDGEFVTKETQDLACLLGTSLLTKIHVSAQYTHISRLPSMMRTRLPLSKHAVQVSGTPSQHLASSNRHNHKVLGTLRGTGLHVKFQGETALVSILHRSVPHLNLVLKLLKESLPSDLSFSLLAEARDSERLALLSSLDALRKEVSDRAKNLETVLQLQSENEGVNKVTPILANPALSFETDSTFVKLNL